MGLDLLDGTAGHLRAFALVFCRAGGLVLVAPGLGRPVVSVQVRLALAFGLAVVLAASLGAPAVEGSAGAMVLALAREAALGAALGLGAAVLLAGVQVAGLLLDQMTGLGLAGALDPVLEDEEGPIGRFQTLLALVLFVACDGHHLLLQGLAASLKAIPPAGVRVTPEAATFVADTTIGSLFGVAVRVCAPTVGALLLATLALALVAKVIPEVNVFLHGFPVQFLVGLAALAVALPIVASTVGSLAADGARGMQTLIRMAR